MPVVRVNALQVLTHHAKLPEEDAVERLLSSYELRTSFTEILRSYPTWTNHLGDFNRIVNGTRLTVLGANLLSAFRDSARRTTVAQYYRLKLFDLKYPSGPCFSEPGGRNHVSYFPIELIDLEFPNTNAFLKEMRFEVRSLGFAGRLTETENGPTATPKFRMDKPTSIPGGSVMMGYPIKKDETKVDKKSKEAEKEKEPPKRENANPNPDVNRRQSAVGPTANIFQRAKNEIERQKAPSQPGTLNQRFSRMHIGNPRANAPFPFGSRINVITRITFILCFFGAGFAQFPPVNVSQFAFQQTMSNSTPISTPQLVIAEGQDAVQGEPKQNENAGLDVPLPKSEPFSKELFSAVMGAISHVDKFFSWIFSFPFFQASAAGMFQGQMMQQPPPPPTITGFGPPAFVSADFMAHNQPPPSNYTVAVPAAIKTEYDPMNPGFFHEPLGQQQQRNPKYEPLTPPPIRQSTSGRRRHHSSDDEEDNKRQRQDLVGAGRGQGEARGVRGQQSSSSSFAATTKALNNAVSQLRHVVNCVRPQSPPLAIILSHMAESLAVIKAQLIREGHLGPT